MSSSSAEARERALIEELSLALVREYLAKKKYRKTLDTLGTELPNKIVPTTTTALAKNLGITKFVTKNAKAAQPYPTLLEIFAEYMYNKYGRDEASGTTSTPSSSTPSTTTSASKPATDRLTSSSKSSSSTRPTTMRADSDEEEELSRGLAKSSLHRPNSLLTSPPPSVNPSSASSNRSTSGGFTATKSFTSSNSPSSYSSNITSSSTGNKSSSFSDRDRDRERDREREKERDRPTSNSSSRDSRDSRDGRDSRDSRSRSDDRDHDEESVIGSLSFNRPSSASRSGRNSSPPRSSSSSSNISKSYSKISGADSSDLLLEEDVDFDEEVESYDSRSKSFTKSGSNSLSPSSSKSSSSSAFPTYAVPSSTTMSLEQVHRVKSLIFGAHHLTGTFTDPWLLQGFYFKPSEVTRTVPSLACGLVQHQGGPCGILAVVQAYILKELLFTPPNDRASPTARYDLLASNGDTLKRALINAWTEILWLVATTPSAEETSGQRRERVVVRACSKSPNATKLLGAKKMSNGTVFKPDGISEALQYCELNTKEDVKNFFTVNHALYTANKGYGCVLFLYSVILTRGVENIEKDRDEASSLIGAHSYCTQEMVNLALTGRARSNVFNGTKDFDGLILRGIDQRSTIGFLSLFEHYENIEVGSFMKQPEYPIWVICSESHYTVGWALDRSYTTSIPSSGVFDLYYYDELANQKEEIKLTVDTTKRGPPPKVDDLEPPINGQRADEQIIRHIRAAFVLSSVLS